MNNYEQQTTNYDELLTTNYELRTTVICLLSSTFVEDSLQISSFLTNKANFRKSQMNVSPVITRGYKNNSNWTLGENKPNSKPNKANLLKAKMNVNFYSTKDYENKHPCGLRKNKPNFRKPKMNVNKVLTKDYENVRLRRRGENKPNTNPISKVKNAAAVRE